MSFDKAKYDRDYSVANKTKILAQKRVWRDANRDYTRSYARDWRLRDNYGLSRADYDAMHVSQGGACAICLRSPAAPKRRLCVDHCHKTGKVRGLLCVTCNTKLGWYERHDIKVANYLAGASS